MADKYCEHKTCHCPECPVVEAWYLDKETRKILRISSGDRRNRYFIYLFIPFDKKKLIYFTSVEMKIDTHIDAGELCRIAALDIQHTHSIESVIEHMSKHKVDAGWFCDAYAFIFSLCMHTSAFGRP